MRRERENKHPGAFFTLIAGGLVIALVVWAAAFLVPAAQAKDNPEDNTRVYRHSYDEVFQATQEAIERIGCFVKDTEKDKGIITGNGKCARGGPGYLFNVEFQIKIETVSTKPETRVTLTMKTKGTFLGAQGPARNFRNDLFMELQKVLVTYK